MTRPAGVTAAHWYELPGVSEEAIRHSERFRKVANRYPRQVAEAYGHDLARAMADTDEQVATTVAAWEKDQGLVPQNWPAYGQWEREQPEGVDHGL